MWMRPPASRTRPARRWCKRGRTGSRSGWDSRSGSAYQRSCSSRRPRRPPRAPPAPLGTRSSTRTRELGACDRAAEPGLYRFVAMTLLVGCMMAMDAEDLLPVSLGSLLKSVDTAIVVDGGSTDGTRSLAKTMGAEVVDSAWPAHNAQQRQVYLDSALERYGEREDVWLMVLDSDELLLGGRLKELVSNLERAGKDHAMLPRMWVVATDAGLMYIASKPHFPDYQLRLYRLRKGLHYTGRIHEVLHGLGEVTNVAAPSIV